MNSYNSLLWSSSPSFNSYSDSKQTHGKLFPSQQYSHQSCHDRQQNSLMTYAEYSTSSHSVLSDYDYSPTSSFIYPNNVDTVQINRLQSSMCSNESSSSSEIDIIADETPETHSSNSEASLVRSHLSSLPSPHSRRVIIQSTQRKVTISNKPQRLHKTQRKYSYPEKHHRHYSSFERRDDRDDHLKRLYDTYSRENIRREWKPLTFPQSQELYQYALDKYQGRSYSSRK